MRRRLLSLLVVTTLSLLLADALAAGQIEQSSSDQAPNSALNSSPVTSRVSIASDGTEGNSSSTWASISANGQVIAFTSYADNLVTGDTNGADDIFVHDRGTGQTTRVSVATDGTQSNAHSDVPAISGNGRFVAFYSGATNLVSGGTNGKSHIFVHDRVTGETALVSLSSSGIQGNGDSYNPLLSADGRYVAFNSRASNLVVSDTNNSMDAFVHDRQTGETSRVSIASDGAQASGPSGGPSLSADGRYVMFTSTATNLVGGDTNGADDVFVHDRETGQTSRVSVASNGMQGNDDSAGYQISSDGRFVVFGSHADNLVDNDTNGRMDVFLHDRLTGQTQRLSVSSSGEQANGGSWFASLSADGYRVAFESEATNLVSGGTNGENHIFVHDRQTGTTSLASVASDGTEANGSSLVPFISADGHAVVFPSWASNLVVDDTNDDYDVFVHEWDLPVDLVEPLTFSPVYPTADAIGSTIQEGGIAYRYYTLRDAAGALVQYANVTLEPVGTGAVGSDGLVKLALGADELAAGTPLPVQRLVTVTGVSIAGTEYALANQPQFFVDILPRPFTHEWYGGTVYKARGGVSALLIAFIEGEIDGGLRWELEEYDASITDDDVLRLQEQFRAELGGGVGIGQEFGFEAGVVGVDYGASLTRDLKPAGLVEWQTEYPEPYSEAAQKAQAAFVLSGLMDITPPFRDKTLLSAVLHRLLPESNYEDFSDQVAVGAGLEWTQVDANAGASIELTGLETKVLEFDVVDAESILRLFGTWTDYEADQEWSLSLEQEVGFEVDLLAIASLTKEKVGVYLGEHTTKLKEELFFDKNTSQPVRLELSLTGEGNPLAFSDIPLQDATITFIVDGDGLALALERIRNVTALLAAWEAIESDSLIVGASAALEEVSAYLSSVPLSDYQISARTEGRLTPVLEIGFTGGLDIELGAGAEIWQSREIVVESGLATLTGLRPTSVYPDLQYGVLPGKDISDLVGNAAYGVWLAVGDAFNSLTQLIDLGGMWSVTIPSLDDNGLTSGTAQILGDAPQMGADNASQTGLLALGPSEVVTITATSWYPTQSAAGRMPAITSATASASGDLLAVGGVYHFQPGSLAFSPSATLVMTYTDAAVAGVDENALEVFQWDVAENNWKPLPATVDLDQNVFEASISQLGTFAVGLDERPPDIAVIAPGGQAALCPAPPTFIALVTDSETGVEPSSVQLELDGQVVGADFAVRSGYLTYGFQFPLPDGSHSIVVTARDTSGNERSVFSSFVVCSSVIGYLPAVLR